MERNFLRRLEAMPSVDIINESLLMSTIFSFVKKDRDIFNFFDVMDVLTDTNSSKQFINTLRLGKIVLHSP